METRATPFVRPQSTARFRHALRECPHPARATQEKRYLKSPFQFIGVPDPRSRSIAKGFRKEHRDIATDTLWGICGDLWQRRARGAGTGDFLLDEFRGLLDPTDMPALERMLRESVNWDQVDEIAVHLVGAVLRRDQRALESVKRWAKDDSFWMRRAALLSQLLLFREGAGDRALFYSLASDMMEEKEFFIRKATGWVLRDIARREPEEVARFVGENRERMSGVTFREATRHRRSPCWSSSVRLGSAGRSGAPPLRPDTPTGSSRLIDRLNSIVLFFSLLSESGFGIGCAHVCLILRTGPAGLAECGRCHGVMIAEEQEDL